MWTKNGGRFLPLVLRRIEEVIPSEEIGQRILVDDHSSDDSRKVAVDFNWDVYPNPTGFISGGSNEALRHVNSEFFISFEQDVVLASNWWDRIPQHMEDEEVAVAQGVRFPTDPILKVLEMEPHMDKRRLENQTHLRIPDYFWSIDNNIFRTKVVRSLGGFPTFEPLAVDYFFMKTLEAKTNYRWVVDPNVISQHIRTGGIREHFEHEYRFLVMTKKPLDIDKVPELRMLRIVLTSPLRGLQIAVRKRYPQFFILYPYIRLLHFKGYIQRRYSISLR